MKKIDRSETRRPPAGLPGTELRVYQPPYHFIFRLESRVSKRMRRTMSLMVFRAIKPVFENLEKCEIYHTDGTWINWIRDSEQVPSFRQVPHFGTIQQSLGLEIRMRRLKAGLTLGELAHHARLSTKHLSKVEHGHHKPRDETVERIAYALKWNTRNTQ